MYQILFVYIYPQSDAGLLNFLEELCITRVATVIFQRKSAQRPWEERSYCILILFLKACT